MDENGKDLKKTISAPKTVNYAQLLKNNTIGCLTAIYNSEKLGKMLMPEIRKRQDYGLWLNILKTGVIGYGIQQPLAIYRIRESSLSNKKTNVLKYNWILLRKHCLLYTSDADDERSSVDLGGRRIIKKKKT